MIRLFMNGLAASAGGGLTYLRNVVPHLARRADVHTTILLNADMHREFSEMSNISFVETKLKTGSLQRFIHEQTALPQMVRDSHAQVLVSTGNFALWRSPTPQILLSRNSLYTSADFLRDVRKRRDYAALTDTFVKAKLAKQSIRIADVTVAPSQAFADELTRWSGREVIAVHHGFDAEVFTGNTSPLPSVVQSQLDQAQDALRLLFVSHYNYYRNFETLFRALPILSGLLNGKKVKLFLTCRLKPNENPGAYRTGSAASLAGELRDKNIVELGTVPYHSLHHLYRACHIYVTPAYTESFSHTLVESMSSGLPIVASDLPVHREICRNAAVYFPVFSPEKLAESVLDLYRSPDQVETLARNGVVRARDFSWDKHVNQLVHLARQLVN